MRKAGSVYSKITFNTKSRICINSFETNQRNFSSNSYNNGISSTIIKITSDNKSRICLTLHVRGMGSITYVSTKDSH
jgi:hypothetical protein